MPLREALRTMIDHLAAPMVVAPMTGVSSLALTDAVTRAGVAGSFPSHVAASTALLDEWLGTLGARTESCGPVLPNLVAHRTNPRRDADLRVICEHAPTAVICSVGSPAPVVPALHEAGVAVLADVASLAHARRAVEAGVDGLVLLAAGAGGQTGSANPFAFIRAVREFFDGPTVLAGGVGDGTSLLAARVAGYDLGYVGTPFIATPESAADAAYRQAVLDADLDDIELRTEFTGIATSMIRSADPDQGPAPVGGYDAGTITGTSPGAISDDHRGPRAFSAGQVVTGVRHELPAADLVARIVREYRAATTRWGSPDPGPR